MDDDLERAPYLQDALGELRSIFGMEVSGRIGQGHVPGFADAPVTAKESAAQAASKVMVLFIR